MRRLILIVPVLTMLALTVSTLPKAQAHGPTFPPDPCDGVTKPILGSRLIKQNEWTCRQDPLPEWTCVLCHQ